MALQDYANGYGHGAGSFFTGARNRQTRTLVIAGGILFVFFTMRQMGFFRSHYESHFNIVHPSTTELDVPNTTEADPKTATSPPGPPRIALPGDNFYLTDALHFALHPPQPPPPPPPPFPDNAAVILETDPTTIPNLVPLLLHTATLLGPRWPVVLLTQRENWIEPATPAFRRMLHEEARIKIFFLPDDFAGFTDHTSVSLFYTKPWFWEQFSSADRVLLFQADSILCANSGAHPDDFAEWDFIGAPISQQFGVGFNGGLSLRNPRMILDLLHELEGVDEGANTFETRLRKAEAGEVTLEPWEKFEDQWFYTKLHERGSARLPDEDVARKFAVETIWEERPMGYHQPFRWLTEGQKKTVLGWCPEASMLEGASHFFGGERSG